ncbi:MAG: hypothetical protein NZ693_06885, partial [Thermoflexales bacterium]|nr:hypothetical protein [Thermoflexales bacterium]
TGTAIAAVLAFSVGLLAARYMLKNRLPLDWRDILSGPLMAMGLTLAGYVLLVRLIGNLEPLWISVAWKVVWALLGFALFSLLVQPKQFMQRISYAWRLVRGRPQAA